MLGEGMSSRRYTILIVGLLALLVGILLDSYARGRLHLNPITLGLLGLVFGSGVIVGLPSLLLTAVGRTRAPEVARSPRVGRMSRGIGFCLALVGAAYGLALAVWAVVPAAQLLQIMPLLMSLELASVLIGILGLAYVSAWARSHCAWLALCGLALIGVALMVFLRLGPTIGTAYGRAPSFIFVPIVLFSSGVALLFLPFVVLVARAYGQQD